MDSNPTEGKNSFLKCSFFRQILMCYSSTYCEKSISPNKVCGMSQIVVLRWPRMRIFYFYARFWANDKIGVFAKLKDMFWGVTTARIWRIVNNPINRALDAIIIKTVKPPVTTTSPQRPAFQIPKVSKSNHYLWNLS